MSERKFAKKLSKQPTLETQVSVAILLTSKNLFVLGRKQNFILLCIKAKLKKRLEKGLFFKY